MTEDAKLAAKKGAALLDEKHPGWAQKIDRERLRMTSCYDCILGQLYDTYMRAVRTLFGPGPVVSKASSNGFNTPKYGREPFKRLESAWLDEIDRRRT